MIRMILGIVFVLVTSLTSIAADANRFCYLDDPIDPYYVNGASPRLTTPQWFGDTDVDAVVVLAIDDMRDPQAYESYLRPILDRLHEIEGSAPLSIMTNKVDVDDPQLQRWLKEGVTIEVHTIDHPCPLLHDSDWEKAKSTYDRCVDLLADIPGNQPVAFRMPCCDSMNTPSPRFYETIFSATTDRGRYLSIDTSVFNVTTADDQELSQTLLRDEAGRDRFQKYLPFKSFVNTIRDYPYPYLIGDTCWEFPCIVPSDWEAQNLHEPFNPQTVKDLIAALDVVVKKQGTMNLVFHPHGWIRNDQVVELLDYAERTYGRRVRFLNFRQAQHRLNRHLLSNLPIRGAEGRGSGTRLLDVNGDGMMDVVLRGTNGQLHTRLWVPAAATWQSFDLPVSWQTAHFGVTRSGGPTEMFVWDGKLLTVFEWQDEGWSPLEQTAAELQQAIGKLTKNGKLNAIRLRDLNHDGSCEVLLENKLGEHVVLRQENGRWSPCHALPERVRILRPDGRDAGLRWIDLDNDGQVECVFSDPKGYGVYRLVSLDKGWQKVFDQDRGAPDTAVEVPPFVRPDGTNNGVWAHSGHLWWQNEDTARLPDKVNRLSFQRLLVGEPEAKPTEAASFPGPQSPEQALKTFASSVAARVELVAAEPMVADPVAFDWGPDGRLWVAEMRDYPFSDDPSIRGRIKVLVDDDGDGRYDRSEVFLDGLNYPTGVKAWRDGILVSGAPHLLFVRDTDGDLRADEQTVLYRGFSEGNQQHLVNGLRWGVDGWLYLANGDSGGTVECVANGNTIDISGRDLRIRPDSGGLEALSGQTQSGRCRDDWGNWFGCNNSFPMWHFVLQDRYLARNRHFAATRVRRQVSEFPGPSPVFPTSNTLPRFNDFDRANRFTSACSPLVFPNVPTAMAFGPPGTVDSFVCEPVHNLVHRERMTAHGVSFHSRRLPEDRNDEFLTSTDNWFRPVMLRIGPDGAIWMADMYRLVIEHPTWIPQEWQDRLDLHSGNDLGRIYRIQPTNTSTSVVTWPVNMSTDQLVSQLGHPNRWHRDMAQQMLIWRQDKVAVELLRQLVRTSDNPLTQIYALHTLARLAEVEDKLLVRLIEEGDPRVARHAIVLSEGRLADSPAILASLLKRVGEVDQLLQQQLAYSLGFSADSQAATALVTLATHEPTEPAVQSAVLSSLTSANVGAVLDGVMRVHQQYPELTRQVLLQAVALGDNKIHHRAIASITKDGLTANYTWRVTALSDLLSKYVEQYESLSGLPADLVDRLHRFAESARGVMLDDTADLATRIAAAQLMREDLGDSKEVCAALAETLGPRQPVELQAIAGETLLKNFGPQAVVDLLPLWQSFSPQVRTRLLDEVLRRPTLAADFFQAAMETSTDLQLDARRRQQIRFSSDERLQAMANELFSQSSDSRENIVQSYREMADQESGDAGRGRVVFQRACGSCHRLAEVGHAVGPDLAALSNKSTGFLLGAILDPNRAVESNYLDYYVATADGRQFSGILRSETASGVTLLAPEGKEQVVLRNDIELMRTTGKSLMPEGLEKDIDGPQMWDLLAYLRTFQRQRKEFDGNVPQVAPVRDDGSIRLLAMHAEIYGPSLVFESKHQNLGFWASQSDYAVWTVETDTDGEYLVSLHYACDSAASGNNFVLSCEDEVVGGQVRTTGTWDDYTSRRVGKLRLPKGRSRIVMRSSGPVESYLVDLRQITLYPAQ